MEIKSGFTVRDLNRVVNKVTVFWIVYLAVSFRATPAFARKPGTLPGSPSGRSRSSLQKIETTNYYSPVLIGNVVNYYGNNGDGSYSEVYYDGFVFPKQYQVGSVFEDGIVWGGYHHRTIGGRDTAVLKVGGNWYFHGLVPGNILESGTPTSAPAAEDPSLSKYRIYRVRSDIRPTPDPDSVAYYESIIAKSEYDLVIYGHLTPAHIYNQYVRDWEEWPAKDGAPYTDLNHDGVYDPSEDIPGVPGADQTLWCVCNDCDTAAAKSFGGSDPIGLEMQRTIWAYDRPAPLGNVVFVRTRIINESGSAIDSMFIGQWADPDLGFAGDDYVGCDSSLGLGYCYNGQTTDASYGSNVPAVGFDILHGPVVSSGSPNDSAYFGMTYRPGLRNLPVTSFPLIFKSAGFALDHEVSPTDPNSVSWWYYRLKGLHGDGTPYIWNGNSTTFPDAGDPVTGTGWLDSRNTLPSDRRLMLSSGPFNMAPGDTQEVLVATLIARGGDRLRSVTLLKSYDMTIQRIADGLFRDVPPGVSATESNDSIHISADAGGIGVKSVEVWLRKYDGSAVVTTKLYDDGTHGDVRSGDNVFGTVLRLPPLPEALYADEFIAYSDGDTMTLYHATDSIVTATPVGITAAHIVSDNINQDGVANVGEDVRYAVTVTNGSSVPLSGLSLSLINPYLGTADRSVYAGNLGPSSSFKQSYNPSDPSTYFSFDVPSYAGEDTVSIALRISDLNHDSWIDTISFPVKPLVYPFAYDTTKQIRGEANGEFYILVVNAAKITGDTYLISWVDSIDAAVDPGYTLTDLTTGKVLLSNHPLPDAEGQTSPEVDGFRVLLGSVDTHHGLESWNYAGALDWISAYWPGLGLDDFEGAIGTAYDYWYSGSTVLPAAQKEILFRFAATDSVGNITDPGDSNASFGYRYLRNASSPPAQHSFARYIINPSPGFAYQDYTKNVPFSAYEVSGTEKRQLMVGFLENNVANGSVDGRYWPPYFAIDNVDTNGPMEWFFVFDENYSTSPDPALEVDISRTKVPMLVFGTPARRFTHGWSDQDSLWLTVHVPPSAPDAWSFTPSEDIVLPPTTINISQNYPNPFNSSTHIEYVLPFRGRVQVKIYDVLGRLVRSLLDEDEAPGTHTLAWNSTVSAGREVASGVYFLRVTFVGEDAAHTSFTSVKKMMVLK